MPHHGLMHTSSVQALMMRGEFCANAPQGLPAVPRASRYGSARGVCTLPCVCLDTPLLHVLISQSDSLGARGGMAAGRLRVGLGWGRKLVRTRITLPVCTRLAYVDA